MFKAERERFAFCCNALVELNIQQVIRCGVCGNVQVIDVKSGQCLAAVEVLPARVISVLLLHSRIWGVVTASDTCPPVNVLSCLPQAASTEKHSAPAISVIKRLFVFIFVAKAILSCFTNLKKRTAKSSTKLIGYAPQSSLLYTADCKAVLAGVVFHAGRAATDEVVVGVGSTSRCSRPIETDGANIVHRSTATASVARSRQEYVVVFRTCSRRCCTTKISAAYPVFGSPYVTGINQTCTLCLRGHSPGPCGRNLPAGVNRCTVAAAVSSDNGWVQLTPTPIISPVLYSGIHFLCGCKGVSASSFNQVTGCPC